MQLRFFGDEGDDVTGKNRDQNQYSWFWQKLDRYVSQQGLRSSSQRHKVMQHFLEHGQHLSAEALHQSLHSHNIEVGIATVYRVLKFMQEAGVVEEQKLGTGTSCYELACPEEHHDHIVCLDCGSVVEFNNQKLETMKNNIAHECGFKLEKHSLVLYGHCQQCSKDLVSSKKSKAVP
jgi:Fur family ferric uptake transcriptional regulator